MHRASIESLESRTLFASGGAAVSFGGPTIDEGSVVAASPDGGKIVGGYFSRTATFGSGADAVQLTAVGDTDVFVAKYSAAGTLEWVRQFGGDGGLFVNDKTPDLPEDPERSSNSEEGPGPFLQQKGETIGGIGVDAAGDIYFTGAYVGTATFNDGTTTQTFTPTGTFGGAFSDIYLIKLNTAGKLTWGEQFGGEFGDLTKGIAVDAAGDAYLTGYFSRTANFNPTGLFDLTSHGRSDIFAAKYSPSGALVWADNMGSNDLNAARRNMGTSIAIDAAGNVYLTGIFAGKSDFDPGPGVFDLQAVDHTADFIEKLDANGGFVWAEDISAVGDDGGISLAVGADGSIYTLSYFENTVNVNPGAGAALNFAAAPDENGNRSDRSDLLVEKLTNAGQLTWAKQISGPGWELGSQIVVDSGGNVYITGSFYDAVNFNTRGTPEIVTSEKGVNSFKDANDENRKYSYDIFMEKLSKNGRFIYVRTFGGQGDDFGLGEAISSTGTLLYTGRFRGTVDFDPSKTSVQHLFDAGIDDGFLLELTEGGALA